MTVHDEQEEYYKSVITWPLRGIIADTLDSKITKLINDANLPLVQFKKDNE